MGLFGPKQQMFINNSILPAVAKKEIMAGRLPQINTNKIFLKQGEVCSYIEKAILNVHIKKRINRHSGVSMPGLFKGHRVHTGSSRPIEFEEIKQQKGILYVTNKRVIFQAAQNAFDKQHRYLSSIEPYSNGVVIQYGQNIYELIVPDGELFCRVLKMTQE